MSKIATILIAIVVVFAFSSCEKDGVYHPKKKISRIYEQPSGEPKDLSEKWVWDGKNLSKILNRNETVYRTFKYEKNRISKITWSDNEYFTFTFDGKHLKRVEYHGATDVLFTTWNFKYTKNKITTMTREEYDNKKSYTKDITAALNLFLPVPTIQSMLEEEYPTSAKSSETAITYYDYEWDGDNIKKATVRYPNYDETVEITYKYDKNNNPYYHFFENTVTSKNNIISSEGVGKYSYNGQTFPYSYTNDYEITYEGKWPKEVLRVYRRPNYNPTRHTTYYEYE